jgi:hypothetical protein
VPSAALVSSEGLYRRVSRPVKNQLRSHGRILEGGTYDDSRNAILRVAVLFEMLRYGYEHTRRESHIEDSVAFFTIILNLQNVLVELLEWLILVVLSGNVCACFTESIELLFNFLRGGLDI